MSAVTTSEIDPSRERPRPERAADVAERWTPVWHAFFYSMIVAATGLLLASWSSEGIRGPRVLVIGLAVALAAWHYALVVRLGRAQRQHPARMLVYLVGATALASSLLFVDPAFLMVAMALYNQVFAFVVMRYALPSSIVLTAAIAAIMTRTAGGAITVGVLVGAVSALLFALFLTANSEESRKRRELIEELERTRLELALAERLAGVTEERHRIARDLHDTVTQQLIGIVMHLDAAASAQRGDSNDMQDAVALSLRLAREGLSDARRLVWTDKPRQLEDGSLKSALERALSDFREATKARAEGTFEGLDELPAAAQTLVLRGVQEALANAKKHARARNVTVSVVADDTLLTVDIADDGVGFDTAARSPAAREGGFGLRGLRSRVEQLRGTLIVESERGRGTTVAFHVPLRKEPA